MKECILCKETKAFEDFNKFSRMKDGLQRYCRDCQKSHYRSNITRHKANVKKVREQYKKDARATLAAALSTGCIDCGILDLRVLELDHVSGDKIDGVASMIRGGKSLATIRKEIEKCEVRCRNCHAIATYTRIGKTWHDEYMETINTRS